MKKIKDYRLSLNKKVISNLSIKSINGGATNDCTIFSFSRIPDIGSVCLCEPNPSEACGGDTDTGDDNTSSLACQTWPY